MHSLSKTILEILLHNSLSLEGKKQSSFGCLLNRFKYAMIFLVVGLLSNRCVGQLLS